MAHGGPLVPRDDPLMALAMLSGRADMAMGLGMLGQALEELSDAEVRAAYDALVEEGLVKRSSRGYKLTGAGKARTRDAYERRIAPAERDWKTWHGRD